MVLLKSVFNLFILLKILSACKLTQDMSTMLSQQHKLRDKIEGCHNGDQGSQPKSLASHYHPFHSTLPPSFDVGFEFALRDVHVTAEVAVVIINDSFC